MKRSHAIIKYSILLLAGWFLAGCDNQEKRQEDEAYIRRIKQKKIREVEPLPEIKPYEPFAYSAFNLRSPFAPPESQAPTKKFSFEGGIHPDPNRRKEPLESFPLDSLRMVGTIEKSKKLWALIIDPSGVLYRLTKGNYVGQNHGRIDNVAIDKIVLTEIVPDPSGGWRERPASMAIFGEGKGNEPGKK